MHKIKYSNPVVNFIRALKWNMSRLVIQFLYVLIMSSRYFDGINSPIVLLCAIMTKHLKKHNTILLYWNSKKNKK